ncbi:MAG: glycosyltransferase [Candidatus Pacebacteria bacterium]|nr:glycosyltransferase [Candidatus Paceibacterota bacterium]
MFKKGWFIITLMKSGLSIIIPVYNEEQIILPTLRSLIQGLKKAKLKFEIIVVNDGSTDETAALLKKSRLKFQLISYQKNKGYGAALKTGIKQSQYPVIAITDADGTYPHQRLSEFYQILKKNNLDLISGARIGKNVQIPLLRRLPKWCLNQFANFVVRDQVPDVNCGLRVYRKKALLPFFSLLPNGFSFTATSLLAMMASDYQVSFKKINYFNRKGKSKINPIKDTINFFKLVFKIGLYFAPLKVFLPISILVLALGLIWGLVSWQYFGHFADASTLMFILTSLQLTALALLAELINKRLPNIYQKL